MDASKLLKIQKRLKPIVKDQIAHGTKFDYKYTEINAILAMLRPILNEEGVVVLQPLGTLEGKCALVTILIDGETGETLQKSTAVLPVNDDPQKMGAIITYFRRYSLVSMFCLEAEDDDAESVSIKTPQTKKISSASPDAPECPDCGYSMWDNRTSKLSPKQPDYSCKKKREGCKGAIWLPKAEPDYSNDPDFAYDN